MELNDMATSPRKPKATTATTTAVKKTAVRKPAVKKDATATKTTATRKPTAKPLATVADSTPSVMPTPITEPVPSNVQTLDDVLNSLISVNPDQVLLTAKKADNITLLSSGEISLPEAIVLIGTLAASIFTEIPAEQKAQYPLSAFMNNISTVTAGRVTKIDPSAPLFVSLTNHES